MRSPSLTSVTIFVATSALLAAFALSIGKSNSSRAQWCTIDTCYLRIPASDGFRVTTGRDTYLVRELQITRNGLPEEEALKLLQKAASFLTSTSHVQEVRKVDEAKSLTESFLSTQISPDEWRKINQDRKIEITFYGQILSTGGVQ